MLRLITDHINLKLAIPPLTGLILIVLSIQFYWMPQQVNKEQQEYEDHIQELLSLSESGIIQNLLEHDMLRFFSI